MERFAEFLCRDERESGTIETYLRSLRGFAEWAAGWKMKKLCGLAGVAGSKVFPHNY